MLSPLFYCNTELFGTRDSFVPNTLLISLPEVIARADNDKGKHNHFILLFCLQIQRTLLKNVHNTRESENSKLLPGFLNQRRPSRLKTYQTAFPQTTSRCTLRAHRMEEGPCQISSSSLRRTRPSLLSLTTKVTLSFA